METVKRSYRDILRFVTTAELWQRQTPSATLMTGFKYAISRVLKGAVKAQEHYNELQTDLNIDAATQDEKGNILVDSNGQTMFTKEQSKMRNVEIRKLLDTEVEVGVYFAKTIPDDLTIFQINAFEGFVLKEMTDPDLPAEAV